MTKKNNRRKSHAVSTTAAEDASLPQYRLGFATQQTQDGQDATRVSLYIEPEDEKQNLKSVKQISGLDWEVKEGQAEPSLMGKSELSRLGEKKLVDLYGTLWAEAKSTFRKLESRTNSLADLHEQMILNTTPSGANGMLTSLKKDIELLEHHSNRLKDVLHQDLLPAARAALRSEDIETMEEYLRTGFPADMREVERSVLAEAAFQAEASQCRWNVRRVALDAYMERSADGVTGEKKRRDDSEESEEDRDPDRRKEMRTAIYDLTAQERAADLARIAVGSFRHQNPDYEKSLKVQDILLRYRRDEDMSKVSDTDPDQPSILSPYDWNKARHPTTLWRTDLTYDPSRKAVTASLTGEQKTYDWSEVRYPRIKGKKENRIVNNEQGMFSLVSNSKMIMEGPGWTNRKPGQGAEKSRSAARDLRQRFTELNEGIKKMAVSSMKIYEKRLQDVFDNPSEENIDAAMKASEDQSMWTGLEEIRPEILRGMWTDFAERWEAKKVDMEDTIREDVGLNEEARSILEEWFDVAVASTDPALYKQLCDAELTNAEQPPQEGKTVIELSEEIERHEDLCAASRDQFERKVLQRGIKWESIVNLGTPTTRLVLRGLEPLESGNLDEAPSDDTEADGETVTVTDNKSTKQGDAASTNRAPRLFDQADTADTVGSGWQTVGNGKDGRGSSKKPAPPRQPARGRAAGFRKQEVPHRQAQKPKRSSRDDRNALGSLSGSDLTSQGPESSTPTSQAPWGRENAKVIPATEIDESRNTGGECPEEQPATEAPLQEEQTVTPENHAEQDETVLAGCATGPHDATETGPLLDGEDQVADVAGEDFGHNSVANDPIDASPLGNIEGATNAVTTPLEDDVGDLSPPDQAVDRQGNDGRGGSDAHDPASALPVAPPNGSQSETARSSTPTQPGPSPSTASGKRRGARQSYQHGKTPVWLWPSERRRLFGMLRKSKNNGSTSSLSGLDLASNRRLPSYMPGNMSNAGWNQSNRSFDSMSFSNTPGPVHYPTNQQNHVPRWRSYDPTCATNWYQQGIGQMPANVWSGQSYNQWPGQSYNQPSMTGFTQYGSPCDFQQPGPVFNHDGSWSNQQHSPPAMSQVYGQPYTPPYSPHISSFQNHQDQGIQTEAGFYHHDPMMSMSPQSIRTFPSCNDSPLPARYDPGFTEPDVSFSARTQNLCPYKEATHDHHEPYPSVVSPDRAETASSTVEEVDAKPEKVEVQPARHESQADTTTTSSEPDESAVAKYSENGRDENEDVAVPGDYHCPYGGLRSRGRASSLPPTRRNALSLSF